MLSLGWLAYFGFGVAVTSITPIVLLIIDDLSISSSQMGIVLGSWQLIYVFTAIPTGIAIDRLGVRKSMAFGLLVIVISLSLRALASSFWTLLLAVSLLGVGGPLISIGVPKIVADWYSRRGRGKAAGIYTTGPVIGSVLVLATASGVLLKLTGSWRLVMIIFAAIVFFVFVVWVFLYREAPKTVDRTKSPHATQNQSIPRTIRLLLGHRNLQLLLIFACGFFALNHGLISWLPTLLEEAGFSLASAGTWVAVSTICGLLTTIAIPRLAKIGTLRRILVILLMITTAGLFLMVLLNLNGLIVLCIITTMARAPLLPLTMLLLMNDPNLSSKHIGTSAGLLFSAGEIGGFFGPAIIGVVREQTGSLVAALFGLVILSAIMIFVVKRVAEDAPNRT